MSQPSTSYRQTPMDTFLDIVSSSVKLSEVSSSSVKLSEVSHAEDVSDIDLEVSDAEDVSNIRPADAARARASAEGFDIITFEMLTEHAIPPPREAATTFDLKSAYDYVIPIGRKVSVETDMRIKRPKHGSCEFEPASELVDGQLIYHNLPILENIRGNISVFFINQSAAEYAVYSGDIVARITCDHAVFPIIRRALTLSEEQLFRLNPDGVRVRVLDPSKLLEGIFRTVEDHEGLDAYYYHDNQMCDIDSILQLREFEWGLAKGLEQTRSLLSSRDFSQVEEALLREVYHSIRKGELVSDAVNRVQGPIIDGEEVGWRRRFGVIEEVRRNWLLRLSAENLAALLRLVKRKRSSVIAP